MAAGQNAFDMQIKLLMIGDSGKSHLLSQILNQSLNKILRGRKNVSPIALCKWFFFPNVHYDHWYWFQDKEYSTWWQKNKITGFSNYVGFLMLLEVTIVCMIDLGYCWSRAISYHNNIIFSWSSRNFVSLWCYG